MSSYFSFRFGLFCWFSGYQRNPGDSIDYLVPVLISPQNGFGVGSVYDHMGLPTVGQVSPGKQVVANSLHLRAYNLIWNEWFRDENLQTSRVVPKGDGPDDPSFFQLQIGRASCRERV